MIVELYPLVFGGVRFGAIEPTEFANSYLRGAYDANQFTGPIAMDYTASYPDGARLTAAGTSDADLDLWSSWSGQSASSDLKFWLTGTTSVSGQRVSFAFAKSGH